jgi:integrase
LRQANGTGSVFKLSGKRRRPWAVRITAGWTDEGKQIFKYLSYHEKKVDAIKALAQYNTNPYDVESSKATFEDIYDKWSEAAYKTLSVSSVKTYKSAYKNTTKIQKMVFRDLRTNALQDVVDKIDSASMARMTKFLFQKMYTYALENDIVEKDYSQYVKLLQKEETKEKSPFSPEEIKTMWNKVDSVEYADVVVILLYTGMRIGELLDMKKEDIHIKERYMIGGSKTEAGKNRIIPLHKKIVPLIEKRMSESKSDYLFTNTQGNQLKYHLFISKYWKELTADLKVTHTPHDTRHTFVSNLDSLGANRVTIQRIVGHANKDTTDIYIHKNLDELLEAVDMLD